MAIVLFLYLNYNVEAVARHIFLQVVISYDVRSNDMCINDDMASRSAWYLRSGKQRGQNSEYSRRKKKR